MTKSTINAQKPERRRGEARRAVSGQPRMANPASRRAGDPHRLRLKIDLLSRRRQALGEVELQPALAE